MHSNSFPYPKVFVRLRRRSVALPVATATFSPLYIF